MLAIDPGFTNYALAIVDVNTRSLLFSCVHVVRIEGRDGDVRTAENIVALLRAVCRAWSPVHAVIEHQGMSQVLRGIEMASIGCLVTMGIPTTVMFAQTIKAHFAQLGFNGHKQNKKDAEALVREFNYGWQVNHVADCILMAIAWIERGKI